MTIYLNLGLRVLLPGLRPGLTALKQPLTSSYLFLTKPAVSQPAFPRSYPTLKVGLILLLILSYPLLLRRG